MKTSRKRGFVLLGCIALWALFWFLQRVACFDLFELNPWYLHPLAVVFWLLQMGVLYLLYRQRCRLFWVGPLIIYCICTMGKIEEIASWVNAPWAYTPGYFPGLAVLCCVLDILSAVITFRLCTKGEKCGEG